MALFRKIHRAYISLKEYCVQWIINFDKNIRCPEGQSLAIPQQIISLLIYECLFMVSYGWRTVFLLHAVFVCAFSFHSSTARLLVILFFYHLFFSATSSSDSFRVMSTLCRCSFHSSRIIFCVCVCFFSSLLLSIIRHSIRLREI